MLKAMRKTVQKNEMFHGGRAEEIFEDMLYDEYSLRLSRTSNLGIAQTMYDQLSRQR
jgi:flagellar protein FlgJ